MLLFRGLGLDQRVAVDADVLRLRGRLPSRRSVGTSLDLERGIRGMSLRLLSGRRGDGLSQLVWRLSIR